MKGRFARTALPALSAANATTKRKRKWRTKMPQLNFSQALTANQLGFNPVSGWQYEYLPWPGQIILLVRATDVNERMTFYSGSATIIERSPGQGSGTSATPPSEINTPPVSC